MLVAKVCTPGTVCAASSGSSSNGPMTLGVFAEAGIADCESSCCVLARATDCGSENAAISADRVDAILNSFSWMVPT